MPIAPHLVIGAGYAGLGVARALRGEGFEVEIVERNDEIGGNWLNGVYDSTHIISSRDTTGYAEFPMPRSYPDFPSREQMLAYLRSYSEAFSLRGLIRFNTEVTRVVPVTPDGVGGWDVTMTTPEGGVETRRYAGVAVCNGHHWDKRMPTRPGVFAGKQLHSKDYKKPSDFAGTRVLVVGAGNSGCDIAVEAARTFGHALISMRRGYHFVPKTVLGIPAAELDKAWLPTWAQRAFMRTMVRVIHGDNTRYGIPRPDHRLFDRHPVVNSEMLHALRHGRVEYRPDIERFDGDTVVFVDGTRERVDTIVYGTGFDVSFPFLDRDLFEWHHGIPKRVFGMLAPRVAGLYVFGVLQPRGGAGPLISRGAGLLARLARVQQSVDHPVALDLARIRRADARHLVGVSETMREIAVAHRILDVYSWRQRRRAVRGRRTPGPGSVGEHHPATAADPRHVTAPRAGADRVPAAHAAAEVAAPGRVA
jgi:cation diffusion facilitator CzcD-associated flavoprotein CzcO